MTHSSRGRRIRATAVAACSAVLLLAGCDADSLASRPDRSALENPAVPAVAVPAADSAPRVDWKAQAYLATGCDTRTEWVADGLPAEVWDAETVQTTFVDVTGDGTDEVLVQVTCPAAASTRANHVVVLDPSTPRLTLLGVLGDDLFHPSATVTTDGTTVTLSGPTIADDDPYCCPGHWGTVTYAWDGIHFVVEERSEVAGTHPAAASGRMADGEHVGLLVSVGSDEISVVVVDWFAGADAVAACREDGVRNHETAWCNQYYVRDSDAQPVTVPVSDSASLSYLDLTTMADVVVDDITELAGTYWVSQNPEGAGYTRFRTENGVITALASIYTP